MQSKDLRIGNYIFIPQIGDYKQIGSIEENGRFTTKNYENSFSNIICLEPIPLTEEWLLNLGFIKHGTEFHKQILDKEDYICVFKDMSVCTVSFKNISHCIYPLEFHVHQLQNLYFTLTGEELELKHKT